MQIDGSRQARGMETSMDIRRNRGKCTQELKNLITFNVFKSSGNRTKGKRKNQTDQ